MRILLIGPHPPPHGGISVHVAGVYRKLLAAGAICHLLDMSQVRPGFAFGWAVVRHALQGWTLHLHTNGHNTKSWLLALACGVAGQFRGGALLTLHSGMTPGYLATGPSGRRNLAALTCSLYRQVICVNREIQDAVLKCGIDRGRIQVLPAALGAEPSVLASEPELQRWIDQRRPLLCTVLFFRPEYGFDLLVTALTRLSRTHPSFGCLAMGSGEQLEEAKDRIKEAGLEDQILLLGDVEHDKCLAIMSLCDVFLRPTLADGDALSVREALSLGIPAVASRVGTRPVGTILFPVGDVEGMLAAIKFGLTRGRGDCSPSSDCMGRLMKTYQEVGGATGTTCLH